MIRVLIIEDESIAARNLQRMLEGLHQSIDVVEVIDSKKEAIEKIPKLSFDLILLDIHLSDGSSFGIFDKIACEKPIIFTTAFDKYMLEAFKHLSIDYLLKPIIQTDLQKAFDKYEAHFQKEKASVPINELMELLQSKERFKKRFLVQAGKRLRSVEIENVAYFHSRDKATYLVDQEGVQFPIEFSLVQLENSVDPENFFRINRRFLVARKSIGNIQYLSTSKLKIDLQPETREDTMLSMDKIRQFKQWLA